MREAYPKLGLTISLIAGGAAILAALSLPLVYFALGYQQLAATLEAEARIYGDTAAVEMAENRRAKAIGQASLKRIVAPPDDTADEMRRIVDPGNRIVVEVGRPLEAPLITRAAALNHADEVFGHIEISRSLRPLLVNTGGIGLLGGMLGIAVFVSLRIFPLRALRLARQEISERVQTEVRLKTSLSMLGATLESTADGILVTDRFGGVVRFNQRYVEMWEIPEQVIASGDHNQALAVVLDQLTEPRPFLDKMRCARDNPMAPAVEIKSEILELKDGQTFELNSRPQWVDEESTGWVWSFHDITERMRAEAMLAGEKRVLQMVVNGALLPEVLGVLTRNIEDQSKKMFCSILTPDKQGAKLLHAPATNLPKTFIEAADRMSTSQLLLAFTDGVKNGDTSALADMENAPPWTPYRELAQSHGLWASRATPIVSSNNLLLGVVASYYREPRPPDPQDLELIGIAANIARIAIERKEAEERLDYLAHYDPLTSLPNRALFRDRLTQALARADRGGRLAALMFLDLDRFKTINDTLGHDIGDLLLKTVAHRLRRCVRDEDTVARLGGDEFTVILEELAGIEDAGIVAKKIIEALAPPFVLDGHEVFVTPSIGITVYPLDSNDLDNLLKNADAAMYRVKEEGRNNYQFYTAEMNARTLERLALENNLRHALERNEFVLYYQPKVDLIKGQIVGMEALMRWIHPTRGIVSPTEFIPLLEETGMIIPVGEWLLRTACRQNNAWQNAGFPHLRMAVNLSARQFQQNDLVHSVSRVLEETGLAADYLELEITESLLMQNPENATDILNKINALGVVRIDIDDFGTGYSSLSYLKRFPISTVKIDASFVHGIPDDLEDVAIVVAVIAMSHSLHLKVIAEGVENEKQLTFLREHNCDELQGYVFSPPLPPAEFEQLLRKNAGIKGQPSQ